ncbi:chemotaxis protein CheB [Pseudomonas sp. HR96]|uniref:chemotaxis protein CheB n=1 Tax=Pseudomonas sp. HR96 TaxID=1027966 RepID=UPI002A74AD21|nr:chemotaxis protein CheB [Pseudomonas sp. HR96]WPO97757.1 chemotaxis protein CheB [Pseudomonas sp. HR96]
MNAAEKLIVIGTSTGGISALQQLLGTLPADLPAAVLVTMHLADHDSILPSLLAPYTRLDIRFARENEVIKAGTVLIAPPGKHLLIDKGRVNLIRGAKENYSRPAIDPFFRSAAISHRRNTIGVVLTGDLDDGTVGLQAIKACGGLAIVQDPADAEAPSMPSSALQYVDPHYCLPLSGIGTQILRLLGQPAVEPAALEAAAAMLEAVHAENEFCLDGGMTSVERMDSIAKRAPLSCPECSGGLWEMSAKPLRYRCHTGHCYTAKTMRDSQDEALEAAVWSVLRALQEKKVLLSRLQREASHEGQHEAAADYQRSVDHLQTKALTLKKLMVG